VRAGYRPSLRLKLIVAFAILSSFVVTGLGILAGAVASRQVERSSSALLTEVAHQMRDKLDTGMFERFRDIGVAASLTRHLLGPGNADGWRSLVSRLQATYPLYAWIGFTDVQGMVVAATGGLLEGKDVSARPWFQAGLHGTHAGDVHEALLLAKLLSEQSEEPPRFVDVAAPVVDADGATIGVLGAHLNWQWAQEVERSVLVGAARHASAEMLVIAQDGQVILGPKGLQHTVLDLGSIRASRADGGGAMVERWPDGRDYVVGYARSQGHREYPGLGWTILARQPLEVAMAPVSTLRQSILLGGLAMLLASLGVGWFMASRLASPLARLRKAADRLMEVSGPVSVPLADDYMEVRSLSHSLDLLVKRLREREEQVRMTVEAGQVGTWDWDMVSGAVTCSDRCREILDFDGALSLAAIIDRVHADDREYFRGAVEAVPAIGELRAEIRIMDRAGEIRWIDARGRVAENRTRVSHFLGTMIDITDRVRLMQELGDSLHEKDILLAEVHHRVKNNLQAICGLLQVESNRLRHNPEARERMHLIGQRIAVLGSIHQHLYTSDNVAEVRIADHFRRLCETLWGSYLDRPVNLTVEAEPLCCDLDTALPLGLIAHELVINSIKHGCTDDRQGTVRIGLHHRPEIGRVVLTVSDDGPGPVEDTAEDTVEDTAAGGISPDAGLGLILLGALVDQIDATVEVSTSDGYRTTVSIEEQRFFVNRAGAEALSKRHWEVAAT
jgi:two-component sensor histidine kinase